VSGCGIAESAIAGSVTLCDTCGSGRGARSSDSASNGGGSTVPTRSPDPVDDVTSGAGTTHVSASVCSTAITAVADAGVGPATSDSGSDEAT